MSTCSTWTERQVFTVITSSDLSLKGQRSKHVKIRKYFRIAKISASFTWTEMHKCPQWPRHVTKVEKGQNVNPISNRLVAVFPFYGTAISSDICRCFWVIDQIRHENHSTCVYFYKTSHKIKLIHFIREIKELFLEQSVLFTFNVNSYLRVQCLLSSDKRRWM